MCRWEKRSSGKLQPSRSPSVTDTALQFQMKYKWPTLEDRLNNPIATELEALEQMASMVELSEYGKKKLKKLREKQKNEK